MDVVRLLEVLARCGVKLYLDRDETLRYKASSGSYSAEWRAVVNVHREALIAALRAERARATGLPVGPSCCAECGATDLTVYLGMSDGTLLCRHCWKRLGYAQPPRPPATRVTVRPAEEDEAEQEQLLLGGFGEPAT